MEDRGILGRTIPMRSAIVLAASLGVIASTRAEPMKSTGSLPPAVERPVSFANDVWPILRDNCVKCHNADKRKGGLVLTTAAGVLAGGDTGKAIIPNKSAESRLVRLISGLDADGKMPPDGKPLTVEQIGILRGWIDQGTKWDQSAVVGVAAGGSSHWAFQPVAQPAIPPVTDVAWPRNGIDRFILARLEKEHWRPAPVADRTTLIRRLSFDLLGLPPAPAEIQAFENDNRADAYELLVERLLSSPHYGERWGRHWLDAARYADSDGYEKDTGRPWAWRYRDYVIQALNADLPFDRFTIEQLAGDLLPAATTTQKIATGFHRNTLTNKEGGVDAEEFRVAAVVDRVSTTGKVFLGLTLGCCQCHDHKFDPVTQREFYQFFAFFNSDREVDIEAALPGDDALDRSRQQAHAARRTELQNAVNDYAKSLSADEAKTDAKLKKLRAALANHDKSAPTIAKAPTLAVGAKRPTHLMIRGDFLRRGVEVQPGTPAAIGSAVRRGNRLDLAQWIVDPANPLTRRVLANWVWQKYFGRGLVATPDDFGTRGERPSHPELLDWLAAQVLNEKWSLKSLHRLIVNSATYRQSSASRPELMERDPLNVLLARQNRLRLEAEVVRDAALSAGALLQESIGGPSIRPPQPSGVSELTYAGSAKWVESKGADKYRRGLYIWFQRTSPYPTLMTFDAPDSTVCAVRRERSNTPLQALTLMNDAVFVEAAQALARRVWDESPGVPAVAKLERLFALTLSRRMTEREATRLLQLHKEFQELARLDIDQARQLLGAFKPAAANVAEAVAWVGVARTLLNLDEFVVRE